MDKVQYQEAVQMLNALTVYQLLDEIRDNPDLVKPIIEVLETEGKLDDIMKDQRGRWVLKLVKGMF